MWKRLPLIVILGATGAGKSKLALEMAVKFGGEIISADSMQVYQGLDIVTNKVTQLERQQVKHHLIDFVDPHFSNYTVVDFRNTAVHQISCIQKRKKLPVVVGGTNYYIESLLWDTLLDTKGQTKIDSQVVDESAVPSSECDANSSTAGTVAPPGEYKDHNKDNLKATELSSLPGTVEEDSEDEDDQHPRTLYTDKTTAEIYSRLREVDPDSAFRIHPSDRRKLSRALQVYDRHGVPMSQLLQKQHNQEGAGAMNGPLRYSDPCIIWVQAEQEVLDKRTDKRVDEMISGGLLQELTDFHESYNKQRFKDGSKADYTTGIFQSIGFKEFHEYLLLSEIERQTEDGQKLLQQGIDNMKMVTRRYARKQKKWMVNRFLKRRGLNVPPVYPVDSTDPSKWQERVYGPATKVLEAFLMEREPSLEPLPVQETTNVPAYNVCEICDGLVFVTTDTWQAHIKGRRHKKNVQRMHALKLKEKLESECTQTDEEKAQQEMNQE